MKKIRWHSDDMDATQWLTNTALAYHRTYPKVPATDIYADLYEKWCARLAGIEALSGHNPDRVARLAQSALKRWAGVYCRHQLGQDDDACWVTYGRNQIRGMLPMLISTVDVTGFGVSGERVKVDGGKLARESGDLVAAWIDLVQAWGRLGPSHRNALFIVFVQHERDISGYEALVQLHGVSYDSARKRVSRALSKLQELMGGPVPEKVYVDFDAELVA